MIKITFLNSFLCEKIDSFQKFLKHALCHKSDFNFSYSRGHKKRYAIKHFFLHSATVFFVDFISQKNDNM